MRAEALAASAEAAAAVERGVSPVPATDAAGDAAAAAAHEAMDDDEKFEALQTENVMASNPESLAYFRANKAMMRKRGGKPLRA